MYRPHKIALPAQNNGKYGKRNCYKNGKSTGLSATSALPVQIHGYSVKQKLLHKNGKCTVSLSPVNC